MKWFWIILAVLATAAVAMFVAATRKKDEETRLTAQMADARGTAPTPASPDAVAQTSITSAVGSKFGAGLAAVTALGAKAGLTSKASSPPKKSTPLTGAKSSLFSRKDLLLARIKRA